MEGGSADELLDVTVEGPVPESFQVEVGRILEDRVQPSLAGDNREECDLYAVDLVDDVVSSSGLVRLPR
jgi:hypothetical protein